LLPTYLIAGVLPKAKRPQKQSLAPSPNGRGGWGRGDFRLNLKNVGEQGVGGW